MSDGTSRRRETVATSGWLVGPRRARGAVVGVEEVRVALGAQRARSRRGARRAGAQLAQERAVGRVARARPSARRARRARRRSRSSPPPPRPAGWDVVAQSQAVHDRARAERRAMPAQAAEPIVGH
jgi:hypothetical protein